MEYSKELYYYKVTNPGMMVTLDMMHADGRAEIQDIHDCIMLQLKEQGINRSDYSLAYSVNSLDVLTFTGIIPNFGKMVCKVGWKIESYTDKGYPVLIPEQNCDVGKRISEIFKQAHGYEFASRNELIKHRLYYESDKPEGLYRSHIAKVGRDYLISIPAEHAEKIQDVPEACQFLLRNCTRISEDFVKQWYRDLPANCV